MIQVSVVRGQVGWKVGDGMGWGRVGGGKSNHEDTESFLECKRHQL